MDRQGAARAKDSGGAAAEAAAVVTADPIPEAAAAELLPEHEEIARLAYSYWEARGRPEGSPEEDWLRAERTLQSRPTG